MTKKFASVLALVVGATGLSIATMAPASASTGDVTIRSLVEKPMTFTNLADGSCHAVNLQGHDFSVTNNTDRVIRVHTFKNCQDSQGNGVPVAKGHTEIFQYKTSFSVESPEGSR